MKFYSFGKRACPNCASDVWKFDVWESYRTRGQIKQYTCFYCGEAVFLGRPSPDKLRDIKSLMEGNDDI